MQANPTRPAPLGASSTATAATWLPWLLLAAGVVALWGPTAHDLQRFIWSADPSNQGPIALAMAAGLFWYTLRKPDVRELLAEPQGRWGPGLAWLLPGLAMYVLGRSQSVLLIELVALIPTLVGLTLMFAGAPVARRLWFCYVFIIFSIPLPGVLVDAITQPLKIAVSWGAEHILRAADYPIARDGVILYLAQYQLLVADACAGLHSLFTLEALGLLYLNVVRHESPLRNVMMAILIVPISIASNTLRVIVLALVTYHLGDEAGQGFVHDFAGIVLLLLALLLIMGTDGVLRTISKALGR